MFFFLGPAAPTSTSYNIFSRCPGEGAVTRPGIWGTFQQARGATDRLTHPERSKFAPFEVFAFSWLFFDGFVLNGRFSFNSAVIVCKQI